MKCCKAFMLMLFPCVAMRPGLEHNLTRGACDGRAFVKTGWVGQGTSEWDVCVVPKQEITQEGCAKYFAYSSKLDRFVACVYYDKVEDLMARNPTRVTARTKRHNVHICSVQDLNPVFKDKPHPPTVKCGKSDVPVKEKIDRWRFHAEKTCKESLCKKAQKGSWRKFKQSDAIALPWPKSISGLTKCGWPMVDCGWKRTAERKCQLTYAGATLIDPEKLFGDLVAEDGNFNKAACPSS